MPAIPVASRAPLSERRPRPAGWPPAVRAPSTTSPRSMPWSWVGRARRTMTRRPTPFATPPTAPPRTPGAIAAQDGSRLGQRFRRGDRIKDRLGLVRRLGVLVWAVGVGHDSAAGLHIRRAPPHQRNADGDRGLR